MAQPVRDGSAAGSTPSSISHNNANSGTATHSEPTVVASGGLSSPISFRRMITTVWIDTAPSNASRPASACAPPRLSPCRKISASPSTPSKVPPILPGVKLRSPSHSAASTPVSSGDSPHSTDTSPECRKREPQ